MYAVAPFSPADPQVLARLAIAKGFAVVGTDLEEVRSWGREPTEEVWLCHGATAGASESLPGSSSVTQRECG